MSNPILFDSSVTAPPPSGAVPVYTTSRLQQLVTGYLAQVRAGVLTLDEAEERITAAFTSLADQQAAAAALRDAEVTGDREGKVAADPSVTSARAARLVEPRTGSQRGAVLAFVVEALNGSTDYEVSRDLRILPNSGRPRRGELVDAGYLVDSGRTRQHRGSAWVVWEATAEGRAWYARRLGSAA